MITGFLCDSADKYTLILNFTLMWGNKKAFWSFVLLGLIIIIKWFSSNAQRVELWYSNYFFPSFTVTLRRIFGGLPFSIGDLLYASAVCWILYKIYRIFYFIGRRKEKKAFSNKITQNIFTLVAIGCVVYIVFNLFWGINYNRKGIAWQLGLTEMKYDTAQLKELNCLLISKINTAKSSLVKNKTAYYSNKDLFKEVTMAYKKLGKQYSYLDYGNPSLKSSMWGWFGNYAGFSGYYNPFTGEAQVNTTIPKFLQPFTSCHEVAHQLGYAKEMEANFVGFLAATASTDTLFHYSVYFDLFIYANRNLFLVDSAAAKVYRKELSLPVQNDLKEWILFNKKHRGYLEPVVRWGYGIFLRSNEQPQGLLSYDEVTGFLIAYYKKFGKI